MIQVNKVIVVGNLTRDPELRHTPSGYPVCSFGLAMNRRSRTPDGQQHEEVSFVEIKAGGKTAEDVVKFLAKGRLVLVEGRLKQERWNAKDGGGPRSKVVIQAQSVQFLNPPQIPANPVDRAVTESPATEQPPTEEFVGEGENTF